MEHKKRPWVANELYQAEKEYIQKLQNKKPLPIVSERFCEVMIKKTEGEINKLKQQRAEMEKQMAQMKKHDGVVPKEECTDQQCEKLVNGIILQAEEILNNINKQL